MDSSTTTFTIEISMAAQNTFINCIFLDWDRRDPDGIINKEVKTREQWGGE